MAEVFTSLAIDGEAVAVKAGDYGVYFGCFNCGHVEIIRAAPGSMLPTAPPGKWRTLYEIGGGQYFVCGESCAREMVRRLGRRYIDEAGPEPEHTCGGQTFTRGKCFTMDGYCSACEASR